MKYEIYIKEPRKSQKFCKKAIAEYEKRLSRYCKISCKFIKKEKEWNALLTKDTNTARQSRTYFRKTQYADKKLGRLRNEGCYVLRTRMERADSGEICRTGH